MRVEPQTRVLVVSAGGHLAGIPLASVRETMRPLAVTRLGGAPHFVLGLSTIRGGSVPVVDLGALLRASESSARFGRFVTLAVAGRSVALAVESVSGVSELDRGAFEEMPPLLNNAARDVVAALTLHDAELLLVLDASRLVPTERELGAGAAP